MAEAPDSVTCPACGAETDMGLPRSASVEAVTERPDDDLDAEFHDDDPRKKRRRNACADGHSFYVYFEF